MISTRISWRLLALLPLAFGGCGTVANLASPTPEVYGGIRNDLEFDRVAWSSEGLHIGPTTVLADLCWSAVADTLTCPFVYYLAWKRSTKSEEQAPALSSRAGATPFPPDSPKE